MSARDAILFAWMISAGVAAAEQTPTPALLPRDLAIRFETADLDETGSLTRDEAIKGGFASSRFAEVDSDRDGIVTVVEIGTYLTDRAAEWVGADRDRDGAVTRAEADASSPRVKEVFNSVDRDADGIVRKQEHEAWAQTSLYQNVDLPVVVPNIINKKF
jgi:hypothetical protein